ncbi:hypothetical protein PIB30_102579, partial [Stylosanthes scabra]|nr:hypothetical protein [Stylosanthes scabra]
MKEEPDPSLNKAEIKRNKSGVEQASCAEKFQHIQLASEAPYQAINVCHNKQKLTADARPMKIDPPSEGHNVKLMTIKERLLGGNPIIRKKEEESTFIIKQGRKTEQLHFIKARAP